MMSTTGMAALVHQLSAGFPPIVMGGLYFLTPLYFAASIWNTSRVKAEYLALILGFCLWPIFGYLIPEAGILVAGLVGGSGRLCIPHSASTSGCKIMTYTSFEFWWWPFVFITLAGVLPNAVWRWAGVFLVGNLNEDSQWMVLIRCVATALVAAVIAQFIIAPSGALASFPFELRISAAIRRVFRIPRIRAADVCLCVGGGSGVSIWPTCSLQLISELG